MLRIISILALTGMLFLAACAKKETAEEPKPSAEPPAASQPTAEAPAAAQPSAGPHAFVHLKDGSKVPGTIVASSQTDMTVAGDDGIERKIPIAQITSVEYGEAKPALSPQPPPREPVPPKPQVAQQREEPPTPSKQQAAQQEVRPTGAAPISAPAITTKTYELPVGSEVSVRMDEAIDSAAAKEGQTFDARLTRDAKDANGDVVIPRGAKTLVVIKSASKGGRFRGASDLVLDLKSVAIDGKQYTIDTAEISEKGKSGVGANKRTATYAGGGAALGAIIGAIAGGGKGAAIGAGSGAGAGVLTQVITKGGAIKVPVESVLTFKLDKPLKVNAVK